MENFNWTAFTKRIAIKADLSAIHSTGLCLGMEVLPGKPEIGVRGGAGPAKPGYPAYPHDQQLRYCPRSCPVWYYSKMLKTAHR